MTCDQPAVTVEHLLRLMEAEVRASRYAGRNGVPAYFPKEYFDLDGVEGDAGARELLRDGVMKSWRVGSWMWIPWRIGAGAGVVWIAAVPRSTKGEGTPRGDWRLRWRDIWRCCGCRRWAALQEWRRGRRRWFRGDLLPRRDCSVAVRRAGFAQAGGADADLFNGAFVHAGEAAMATLEMACALRVPTLRM